MTKRALRARFGFKTNAHLAVVLQLPANEVESWTEEGMSPTLPQIQKLLGFEPEAQSAAADQGPDGSPLDGSRVFHETYGSDDGLIAQQTEVIEMRKAA